MLYLVFEYLDTDLKKYIDSHRKGPNPRPLPPTLIQSFLYQLCKGVAHCHSHGVLHRDLKPQNLLVDKDKGILKIADLGLGRSFTVPLKSYTHENMLKYDPADRISAKAALDHPYFDSLDKSQF
nr:cell division control protein 2 homolog C [Ipomoea batatas]